MFSAIEVSYIALGETVKAVSDESDLSDPKGVWKIFFIRVHSPGEGPRETPELQCHF